MLASRERRDTSVALTSTLHWFETEVLAEERNYDGLTRVNAELIQHVAARSPSRRVTLDIDSSESPVHGTQEQSAYNGHFESVCYHPLFVFNPEGDCLAATLRPGNVHSAERWDEVLLPIIDQYRRRRQRVMVRADAAFAMPTLYEALERRRVRYAIRLPANDVLERQIEDLLTRPRGRPSHAPLVRYRSFYYQAASWGRPRRVIAKVEHHLGELFPRVGFIVTTLTGTNRSIVRFYNQRGTAEQWIKEGKTATHWTRLSCHRFRANEVRLLLGVIAYNLGNLLRRLVLPVAIKEPVAHEPAAAAIQNRRAADPARAVLHAATRRKLLDRGALSADSPAHRAAGAPHVIGREQPRVARRATAGVSVGNDGLCGRASTEMGLATVMPQERAVSPECKPRNRGRQAVAPSPAHGVETRMAPNRKPRLRGEPTGP
jgi:Transposase DDE domain group 1